VLLFDDTDVERELLALIAKLSFRSPGGAEAGGGRPKAGERVLNGIKASLPAGRGTRMGELVAQLNEPLLDGADLGLKISLAIMLRPHRRFRAGSLICGGKLSVQFSERGGQRRSGVRGMLCGGGWRERGLNGDGSMLCGGV
jgi:hypothetical protein